MILNLSMNKKSTRNNMNTVVILLLLSIAFIVFIIYSSKCEKQKEDYSYIQYLDPEDELRTSRDLDSRISLKDGEISFEDEGGISGVNEPLDEGGISGCPCGALSKFEIPYYMRGSMCNTGASDTYNGDPGYFLGRTVI